VKDLTTSANPRRGGLRVMILNIERKKGEGTRKWRSAPREGIAQLTKARQAEKGGRWE